MGKSRQIFILGAPRSGTSFLASLLEFTSFGKPFETHFITKYYKILQKYGDISKKNNFIALLTDIINERPVRQWKLNLDLDTFYSNLAGNFYFSNIVDKLCLERNKQYGLKKWGDKTPHYLGDLEIISSLFPDAKFIYIVRDGRDVALSLLKKNWGPNNIYTCAEYWKKLNIKSSLMDRLESNQKLIRLSYEELLNDTTSNVRRIYNFLEEKYVEDKLIKLCSTVKADNYYKWKNQLSKRQVKIFDLVAANTLSRFGYQTYYPENGINRVIKFLYKLHELFFRIKFLFEINIIDGFKIRFLGKEPFAE